MIGVGIILIICAVIMFIIFMDTHAFYLLFFIALFLYGAIFKIREAIEQKAQKEDMEQTMLKIQHRN